MALVSDSTTRKRAVCHRSTAGRYQTFMACVSIHFTGRP